MRPQLHGRELEPPEHDQGGPARDRAQAGGSALAKRLAALDDATRAMAQTRDFGKHLKLRRLLDSLRRVLLQPDGCAAIQSRAQALEEAGLFMGTDWASPEILIPALVGPGLRSGDADTLLMEAVRAAHAGDRHR
jgi:hypothetical protein